MERPGPGKLALKRPGPRQTGPVWRPGPERSRLPTETWPPNGVRNEKVMETWPGKGGELCANWRPGPERDQWRLAPGKRRPTETWPPNNGDLALERNKFSDVAPERHDPIGDLAPKEAPKDTIWSDLIHIKCREASSHRARVKQHVGVDHRCRHVPTKQLLNRADVLFPLEHVHVKQETGDTVAAST